MNFFYRSTCIMDRCMAICFLMLSNEFPQLSLLSETNTNAPKVQTIHKYLFVFVTRKKKNFISWKWKIQYVSALSKYVCLFLKRCIFLLKNCGFGCCWHWRFFLQKSLFLLDPRHDIIVRIYIFWFLQKIVIYFICNISGLCFKNMWVFENQSTFFNVASFTTINETHICSRKYLLGFLQHYLSTVKLF